MQLPFETLLKALVGEIYTRRNTVFIMFAVISLSLLVVGTIWPKKYTASTTILADETNILQPLMRGTAETTPLKDLADNAREIISGEKIMDEILKDAGWLKNNPSKIEQAKIKASIKKQIHVQNMGKNLLKIEYRDSDAMRAYITAKRIADLFIQEGEKSKIEESKAAYDFINKQVNEYLQKLTKVEDQLREFKSDNPDTRPGLEQSVSNRISRLESDIEQTKLQLREAEIRHHSIQKQLSGEAAITISQSKEGQYRSKIADLQSQLETLRLDYKETYPDIVRIKHQITDLKEAMNQEIEKREEAKRKAKQSGHPYIDENIVLNPLYQQLRSNASTTETQIATLKARISELDKMLQSEYEKARKIHGGEATLTKLTRDYQVNQEIYQDLLRRKERARVSKSLDQENQGLTFKIQEPAKVPLIPTGLRFIHFAAAGIFLGLLIPVGLIYTMLQVDPRVRFSSIISNDLNLPVLAEINQISSDSEIRKQKINLFMISTGMMIIFAIYGYIGWLKFMEQL